MLHSILWFEDVPPNKMYIENLRIVTTQPLTHSRYGEWQVKCIALSILPYPVQ